MGALSNEVSLVPQYLIGIGLISLPAPQTRLLRRLLQGYPICRCSCRVAIGRKKIQLPYPVSTNSIYLRALVYLLWLQVRHLVGTLRFRYALRDSPHLVSHPRHRAHGGGLRHPRGEGDSHGVGKGD